MKKSELREIIIEEFGKLNESRNVDKAMDIAQELSAGEMENLLKRLSNYFLEQADELPNMDAKGIAALLKSAEKKLSKRTSD